MSQAPACLAPAGRCLQRGRVSVRGSTGDSERRRFSKPREGRMSLKKRMPGAGSRGGSMSGLSRGMPTSGGYRSGFGWPGGWSAGRAAWPWSACDRWLHALPSLDMTCFRPHPDPGCRAAWEARCRGGGQGCRDGRALWRSPAGERRQMCGATCGRCHVKEWSATLHRHCQCDLSAATVPISLFTEELSFLQCSSTQS